MSTQTVQYYPQSTRNIGLYETSCWRQYSVCLGIIFRSDSTFTLLWIINYILNRCYNMLLASCIDIVCLCPYIRIVTVSDTFSKSLIVCNISSGYCWKCCLRANTSKTCMSTRHLSETLLHLVVGFAYICHKMFVLY